MRRSMRILVVGATGTIGTAITEGLRARHEVIPASHAHPGLRVDLSDAESIRRLYASVGRVDAVVSAAGRAAFGPMLSLTDADFGLGLANKLMGQVNLVRLGLAFVADGGSFTLSGGILSRQPMVGGAAISMVNAGLEGFVRGAAMELPRGIRINAVAPGWVRETLTALNMNPDRGMPAVDVAESYIHSVEVDMTGQVFDTNPLLT